MLPPAWKRGALQSYTRSPKGAVVRKTIGEAFLETANRFADRVALTSRHQNILLTWAGYAREAARRGRPARARPESRRSRRSMGHELCRMADCSIRLRTGGRCSGKRESGRPSLRRHTILSFAFCADRNSSTRREALQNYPSGILGNQHTFFTTLLQQEVVR